MSVLINQPGLDFTAPAAFPGEAASSPVQTVSLADCAGRWLLFFWYPNDFTFVCPTEILAFSDRLDEFEDAETDILAASVDSVYSHRVWANTPREANGIQGVRFPIVSDATHSIAHEWGVLLEDEGVSLRGLFIVDPEGVVQYAALHNLNVGRSADETLRVLSALQSGGLCGSDWKPGREMLRP